MKRLLLLLLSAMLVFTSCIDTKKVFAANDSAYAVLIDSGELIFFRSTNEYEDSTEYDSVIDIENNKYKGVVFSNVENGQHSWTNEDYIESIVSVKVADNQVIKPSSTQQWFHGCLNLASFNAKGFDTSNVTSMESMFNGCNSLTSIDLSVFNTQNVTNMCGMFHSCRQLKSINVENFSTNNVTRMESMFQLCTSLESLDLSSFNTENITNMWYMFSNCWSIKELNLSNSYTPKLQHIQALVSGCTSLEKLNIENFVTTNVYEGSTIFDNCHKLVEVVLGKGFDNWISNAYLPEGIWNNNNLYKTEIELYKEYPSNAEAWAGTWRRLSVEYTLLEKSSDTWEKGSTKTLDFRFGRNFFDELTFNSFESITVDGSVIDEEKFTKESGSITIKLNPDYLNTLASGEHTLTASFTDGNDVTVKFNIIEKNNKQN